MEAILFLLDLLLITYLCWRVVRADNETDTKHRELGLFGYREDEVS